MATWTHTETNTAIYYVGNQTLRGLFVIVTEVGLGVTPLLRIKEDLEQSLHFHLDHRSLRVLRLSFLDTAQNPLAGGFSIWDFFVKYGASGSDHLEFPVASVLDQIRSNRWAFANVASYRVTLWLMYGAPIIPNVNLNTSGGPARTTELPRNWDTQVSDNSSPSRYIGTYGFEPLHVNVCRS